MATSRPLSASAEPAQLMRVFGIRLAVVGAVLCLAGAPFVGLVTLLVAAALFAKGT